MLLCVDVCVDDVLIYVLCCKLVLKVVCSWVLYGVILYFNYNAFSNKWRLIKKYRVKLGALYATIFVMNKQDAVLTNTATDLVDERDTKKRKTK